MMCEYVFIMAWRKCFVSMEHLSTGSILAVGGAVCCLQSRQGKARGGSTGPVKKGNTGPEKGNKGPDIGNIV